MRYAAAVDTHKNSNTRKRPAENSVVRLDALSHPKNVKEKDIAFKQPPLCDNLISNTRGGLAFVCCADPSQKVSSAEPKWQATAIAGGKSFYLGWRNQMS